MSQEISTDVPFSTLFLHRIEDISICPLHLAEKNGPNSKPNNLVLKFQTMFACTTIEIHQESEIRVVSL